MPQQQRMAVAAAGEHQMLPGRGGGIAAEALALHRVAAEGRARIVAQARPGDRGWSGAREPAWEPAAHKSAEQAPNRNRPDRTPITDSS